MERIERNFNILLQEDEHPYFQVTEDKRVYIPIEVFEGKPTFLKSIVNLTLAGDSEIDVTFYKYSYSNSYKVAMKPYKHTLYKAIKIKNWKEYEFTDPDEDLKFVFVTVKNIRVDEVIRYCMNIVKGKSSAHIAFYNDDYLLTISSDYVHVISRTPELIIPIKEFYEDATSTHQ
ncbi:hypothetical protein ABE042_04225 [Viridibacillus arvi]|uniref:hypothetical protein n=1 Tax=Viridibacillus arvi TaxID=263475 RepID=UPI003D2D0B2D